MRKKEKTNIPASRIPRQDGEETRLHILDIAGRLFAERGYAATTCKEICLQAETNISAVNYHFGGKDGLYSAVLVDAHDHFINMDTLAGILDSTLDAHDKLERVIDGLVDCATNEGWYLRVLLREELSPNPPLGNGLNLLRSLKSHTSKVC